MQINKDSSDIYIDGEPINLQESPLKSLPSLKFVEGDTCTIEAGNYTLSCVITHVEEKWL